MFGKRKRRGDAGEDEPESGYDEAPYDEADYEDEYLDEADYEADDDEYHRAEAGYSGDRDAGEGPFDLSEAPEDEVPRIDLGSVRLPVPDGAQLQVEMDEEGGGVRAVHLLTAEGQFTVNAYAAPRSAGLWQEVADELADQLRNDGASVSTGDGPWGEELVGAVNDVALRFVGVDGPRWLLRGVVAGPRDSATDSAAMLRGIVRDTVVARGDSPMPVRTPLPLELPDEIAEQVAEAQQEQAQEA